MAVITAAMVKELRVKTDAPMMECKKALTEADGNMEQAEEILRVKLGNKATKAASRITADGVVAIYIDEPGKIGAIVELNSETDFVAKNADFVALTNEILDLAIANKCATIEDVKALPMGKGTVADAVIDRSGITGEKMELDGYGVVEGLSTAIYIHPGNRLATAVSFNVAGVDAQVSHEVAMQIAAMNPIAVNQEGVPADVLAREKEIAADKARQEGKPENLIERIAEGRISKFYKEVCLLEQEYVKDPKISVAQFLKNINKDLTVVNFKRFTLNAD